VLKRDAAALLVVGLFAASGCGPGAPPFDPPAQLIADFESGIGLDQARSIESAKGLDWEVEEFERYLLERSEAEVVVTHARISRYSHYGVPGELVLVFKNDLLTRIDFYPSRLEEYLAEYEKHEGVNLRNTGLGYEKDDTVIWLWARPGEEFIGWRDDRLANYFVGSD
jgi:hypothetical protein